MLRRAKSVSSAQDVERDALFEDAERLEDWAGLLVVGGIVLEAIVAISPLSEALTKLGNFIADASVAGGVYAEIRFGRIVGGVLKAKLADAHTLAFVGMGRASDASSEAARATAELAKANEKLAEAIDRATELEAKLQPREINQEQWDAIQALSGEYDFVNIVCETDAETKLLAKSLFDAFLTAQIGVSSHGLEPGIHGVGVLVYEPKGYDGARPRTVGPLIDMLQMSAATMPVHIITELPGYAALPIANGIGQTGRGTLDAPAIIIGGRFILPPAHWPPSRPHAKGG